MLLFPGMEQTTGTSTGGWPEIMPQSTSRGLRLHIIMAMGPLIDRGTGAVRLSADLVLTPGLSPDRVANYVTPAERNRLEKSLWVSPFQVSTIYGVLDVSMFYKKNALRALKLCIKSEFGPQQALIKVRHDGFLTELLGRPTSERPVVRNLADKIFLKALGQDWPKNAKVLIWKCRWGTVTSDVSLSDGLADFRIDWNS